MNLDNYLRQILTDAKFTESDGHSTGYELFSAERKAVLLHVSATDITHDDRFLQLFAYREAIAKFMRAEVRDGAVVIYARGARS